MRINLPHVSYQFVSLQLVWLRSVVVPAVPVVPQHKHNMRNCIHYVFKGHVTFLKIFAEYMSSPRFHQMYLFPFQQKMLNLLLINYIYNMPLITL